MRPPALRLALCLSILPVLGGCAGRRLLGEDWATLDAPARDGRAVEILRGLFAEGVDGAGSARPDREVVRCDAVEVSYLPPGDGAESTLRWEDVDSIQSVTKDSLPARPETLYIYLAEGSPSLGQLSDLVFSPLASAGVTRPYVELRQRPRWSRNRMLAALDHLRRRRPGPAARPQRGQGGEAFPQSAGAGGGASRPDEGNQRSEAEPIEAEPIEAEPPQSAQASDQAGAPTPSQSGRPDDALEAIERKLLKLKSWYEQGLIDEAQYKAKRQELLEGL